MRKIFYIGAFLFFILLACCFTPWQNTSKEQQVANTVQQQVDSFMLFIKNDFLPAVQESAGQQRLRQLFLQARLMYKRFEWAAEYFTPGAAKLFNGPPAPSSGMGNAGQPQGLQVIEPLLFPVYDTVNKALLVKQLQLFISPKQEINAYFNNIPLLNWQIFDAVKLEVFRIETLGITGFDSPIAENSMNEAAAGLSSIQNIMKLYSSDTTVQEIFSHAQNTLTGHADFNSFDRAAFIRQFAGPLSGRLTSLESELHIPTAHYSRLLRENAATLFDTGVYNVSAYAPGMPYRVSREQVALGQMLFNDPCLSGAQKRSCASCHNPAKAFSDGLIKNTGLDGHTLLARNTPTLLNAALQPSQFYDMRSATLEDQVMDVLQNPAEMGADPDTIVNRLSRKPTYRQLFAGAFAGTAIDTTNIAHAIAEYVRSLVKLNSRFDDYMRGNKNAINRHAVNGFNLFMGKAKCGTCHYMPLFNGVLPPAYSSEEPEVIGVPAKPNIKNIDSDEGVYDIVSFSPYHHAFKTPSIRNAAVTAPYMHNGVFKTLKEVLSFYNDGGGTGHGIFVPNQTLAGDSLHLTSLEITDIAAFIQTLNSR